MRATLTRFAPAPTGWLHLGHVLNALYVWETARATGCRVLLRIEDHDRQRARAGFETGILEDLDWLGFTPDVYPTDAYRAGRCEGRQSDREAVYREAVQRLIRENRVYACDCTRRTLGSGAGSLEGAEPRYPGTCRGRGLPLADGHGWRVVVDDGTERFDDLRLGTQAQTPSEECGDFLIRDRLGNWTYQFAVTVDDWRQGIDLVIRGADLLPSTGRQIYLGRVLGRPAPPAYVHHPLIMAPSGRKLSKTDAATGVRDLRAAGWTREEVLSLARRQEPGEGLRGIVRSP